jgi:hypothetical protein
MLSPGSIISVLVARRKRGASREIPHERGSRTSRVDSVRVQRDGVIRIAVASP